MDIRNKIQRLQRQVAGGKKQNKTLGLWKAQLKWGLNKSPNTPNHKVDKAKARVSVFFSGTFRA